VPPVLDDVIARMISKDPATRPRDGSAVASELAALPSIDDASQAPSTLPRAITAREQRILSVVLAAAPPGLPEDPSTEPTLDVTSATARLEAIRRLCQAARGQVEPLAGGALAVAFAGGGVVVDQVARAARCALALRVILPEAPLAVATGKAVVGPKGTGGEAFDRAAALLSNLLVPTGAAAPPIRVDEVTAGLLQGRFVIGTDGPARTLLGEQDVEDAGRGLLGRATPFVGRDHELTGLLAILEQCVTEPVSRAVLVTGPAGVGKSRLCRELLARVRDEHPGVEVWIARGDPIGAHSPFGMAAQLIRRAAGVRDGEPLDERRRKLRDRVARHLATSDVPRVAAFLAELIGASSRDDESGQLAAARENAMLMGDQMRRAWEDLLCAECAAHPLMIVLEDLHWGDVPTVKFVDASLRGLREAPLLVVALGRPEVDAAFPNLWAERSAHQLRLGELGRRASERLVRQVLGAAAPETTVARVVEQASGNAFYLEELLRAVAEGKEDALPETVLAMVQGRLERLDDDARRILRAGSVFGQEFWRGGVLALLGQGIAGTDLDARLRDLVERETISPRDPSKFPGEVGYVFRHGLVRDAAYGMITEDDLVAAHRLAGGWLESKGEGDAARLGEHFERGKQAEQAIRCYLRAAEQALEGNDLVAALAWCDRGAGCGAEGEARGTLEQIRGEALQWRGDNRSAAVHAAAALRLLSKRSAAWFRAARDLAESSGRIGFVSELLAVSEELALGGAGASVPELLALFRALVQTLQRARIDVAARLLQRMERVAAEIGEGDPMAVALSKDARAWWLYARGQGGSTPSYSEDAADAYERAGDLRSACRERGNAGFGYFEVGQHTRAEALLRANIALAERLGLPGMVASSSRNLGLALLARGEVEQAEEQIRHALALVAIEGSHRLAGFAGLYHAMVLEKKGDLATAEREARAALAEWAELPLHAYALAFVARLELAQGRTAEASADAEKAFQAMGAAGGIEEGEALVRLVHAEALHAAGRLDDARTAIGAARDRLLARAADIDAPLRESFLANVPDNARTLEHARAWLVSSGAT